MIDYQLIEKTQNQIICSLDKRQPMSSQLYKMHNVLPDDTIKKLKEYIENENAHWESYQPLRHKISWQADTVIEELHTAFENVTDKIQHIFESKQYQNFLGITVWKDFPEFEMNWHTDNSILSTALQLYLFDTCPPQCGTTFIIDNEHVDLPFLNNTGYILNQNLEQKIIHKPSCNVPDGINRYSLYASWSLSKKLPN